MKIFANFKNSLYMLKIISDYSCPYLIVYSFLTLLDGVYPLVALYLPKMLVDIITNNGSIQEVITLISIYATIGILYFLTTYLIRGKYLQPKSDMLFNHIALILKQKVANLDMRYLEDPTYHDMLEKATKVGQGEGTNIIHQTFSLISNLFSLLTISFVIININVWIVIVALIVVVINAILTTKSRQVEVKVFNDLASNRRQIGYNIGILADQKFSKEIRIFNLQGWIEGKAKSLIGDLVNHMRKSIWKIHKYSLIGSVFNIFQEVLLFLLLGLQTLRKSISVGDFVLYVNAISTYSEKLNAIISSIVQINTSGKYIDNFKQFLELKNQIITNEGERYICPKNNYNITFSNVSFYYPGHENIYVLKRINLVLKSGLKYALVGANGAGKTTLVKLLLRLYDPIEGKITINENDIRSINHVDYQNNYGVVFQDYQTYAYTIRENIVLNRKLNKQKMIQSIEQAGLDKKIYNLKNGVETNIQKIFDAEGIEFSGGEQQKLAIARCLYSESNIFVLDEPSAALDPFAEKEIYESVMKLRPESTVLFITHRLTSVKKADIILYMENGEICEEGTHEELMRKQGKYSVLYNTQAEQYK